MVNVSSVSIFYLLSRGGIEQTLYGARHGGRGGREEELLGCRVGGLRLELSVAWRQRGITTLSLSGLFFSLFFFFSFLIPNKSNQIKPP